MAAKTMRRAAVTHRRLVDVHEITHGLQYGSPIDCSLANQMGRYFFVADSGNERRC